MTSIREITRLSNGQDLDIEYPIILCDADGNKVYYERSDDYWTKSEYKDGNKVYFEDAYGFWERNEYKDGKQVYYECSNGSWYNCEYDEEGNEVYFRDSDGYRVDNREPVDMTIEEVCKELGRNVRVVE